MDTVPASALTRYSANFSATKATRSFVREPTFTSTTSWAALTNLCDLAPTTATTKATSGEGRSIQPSSVVTSSLKSPWASRSTTTRRSTRKGGVLRASITAEITDSPALVTSFTVKSCRAKEGSRSPRAAATTLCRAS